MIRKIKQKAAWVAKHPSQVAGTILAHSRMAAEVGPTNYLEARKAPKSHQFGCGIKTEYSQFQVDKWRLRKKYPVILVLVGDQVTGEKVQTLTKLQQELKCHFFAAPNVANSLREISNDDHIATSLDGLATKDSVDLALLRSTIMQTHMDNDIVLIDVNEELLDDKYVATMQFVAYNYNTETDIVTPSYVMEGEQYSGAEFDRANQKFTWIKSPTNDIGQLDIPRYTLNTYWHGVYIKFRALQQTSFSSSATASGLNKSFSNFVARAWQQNIRTLTYSPQKLPVVKLPDLPLLELHAEWLLHRKVTDSEGRVRVIYVLNATSVSGGIKTVFEHVNGLLDRGFSVELWSLQGQPEWMDVKVGVRKFYNYEDMGLALRNEDAIKVATWWETSPPVWIGSVNHGIGVNFIQEFESWFYPDDPLARAAVVSTYRKELVSMTTSSYNRDELEAVGLTDLPLIPVGYDGSIYYEKKTVQRDDDTMLAVGRSFFQKNFEFTKQAWLSLGVSRPKLELFGSEPDILSDEKAEYHVRPSNDEVNDLYNRSTVLVQTSRHEGFCLPVIEAMAAGCPVICTDAHGNRDFSIDGKTCLLVEHDNIPQLAGAIETLLGDKALQAKLRKNGLEMAKNYEWTAIIDRVGKFYKEIS